MVATGCIAHICVFVGGVIRAFPSAHQSLHITAFIAASGWEDTGPAIARGVGGGLATLGAWLYYRSFVLEPSDDYATHKGFVGVIRDPAYFYAKLVRDGK